MVSRLRLKIIVKLNYRECNFKVEIAFKMI